MEKQIIYLNLDAHPNRVDFVITHELTHAFIYSYGFDQVDTNEEIFCDFVGLYGRDITKMATRLYKTYLKIQCSRD